jgi:outer membrane protein assembly factor BamB
VRTSSLPAKAEVFALRATDGKTLWTWQGAHEFGSLSSPTTDGTTVYVGLDGASRVVALDAHSGAVRWTRTIGAQQTGSTDGFGVALVGNAVYASSAEGQVRALDAATGAVRWSAQASGPVYGGVDVSGSTVLVVTSGASGVLEARSVSTGALVWSTPVSSHCCVSQAPSSAAGVVYVATTGQSMPAEQSAVTAVDLATGSVLRRVDLPTRLGSSMVSVSQGHLYLGYGGQLLALGLP